MAIYAIGDIHGCRKSLEKIFEQLVLKKDDRLVFVGDYVDRGPDSKGVVDFLLKLKKNIKCHFIRGNHEILMLDAKKDVDSKERWLFYGGEKTLDSYNIEDDQNWNKKIPKAHWNFIENTLPYLELDNFIFVHAGLKPKISLNEQKPEDLYWNHAPTPKPYKSGKTVICGHTARKNGEIANFGHSICIDTFVYGGKWLTCLNLETMEYFQANEKGKFKKGRLK